MVLERLFSMHWRGRGNGRFQRARGIGGARSKGMSKGEVGRDTERAREIRIPPRDN